MCILHKVPEHVETKTTTKSFMRDIVYPKMIIVMLLWHVFGKLFSQCKRDSRYVKLFCFIKKIKQASPLNGVIKYYIYKYDLFNYFLSHNYYYYYE